MRGSVSRVEYFTRGPAFILVHFGEVILHIFYSHLNPSPRRRTVPVEKRRDTGNETLSLSFPILDPKQRRTVKDARVGFGDSEYSVERVCPNFLPSV